MPKARKTRPQEYSLPLGVSTPAHIEPGLIRVFNMWNNSASVIQAELGLHEKLLWSGKPRGGIALRLSDIYTVPFSLLWCGFAIFWETMVLTSGAPLIMKFWGVPFVLVGLYMLFGRFLVEARQRAQTYYGVTNERVIVVSLLFTKKVKSINLRTLTDISLDEKADGSGTIIFGPSALMATWGSSMAWPRAAQYVPPSFEMLPDVKSVYDIIRAAQMQASEAAA